MQPEDYTTGNFSQKPRLGRRVILLGIVAGLIVFALIFAIARPKGGSIVKSPASKSSGQATASERFAEFLQNGNSSAAYDLLTFSYRQRISKGDFAIGVAIAKQSLSGLKCTEIDTKAPDNNKDVHVYDCKDKSRFLQLTILISNNQVMNYRLTDVK